MTGDKIEIDNDKRSGYVYYINCLPDAFRNAAKTLDDRVTKNGVGDDTKEWVKGQDAVFANCGGDAAAPAELTAGPSWLKQDRSYQIAAALLYQGKNAEPRTVSKTIAKDKSSRGTRLPGSSRLARISAKQACAGAGIRRTRPADETKRRELLQKAVVLFWPWEKLDERIPRLGGSAARSGKVQMTRTSGKELATPSRPESNTILQRLYDYSLFINVFYRLRTTPDEHANPPKPRKPEGNMTGYKLTPATCC